MQNRIKKAQERIDRLTRRRPKLVASATRQLGCSTLAEDVVQDALMVVLLEKHHTCRDGADGGALPEDEHRCGCPAKHGLLKEDDLDKYLYGIIRNKCSDIRRRSAKWQRALDRMQPTSTLDADPTASASSRQLLQFISPKARPVIELRLEGRSFVEIAKLLNVKVEATRRRHCDAMKTLRALLDLDDEQRG